MKKVINRNKENLCDNCSNKDEDFYYNPDNDLYLCSCCYEGLILTNKQDLRGEEDDNRFIE